MGGLASSPLCNNWSPFLTFIYFFLQIIRIGDINSISQNGNIYLTGPWEDGVGNHIFSLRYRWGHCVAGSLTMVY